MIAGENKAVFLSYASQDAAAAQRICEALRAAGVEVWFDQSELVGGDQWDGKIRGQIGSCALFVPVISANTQARLEGYFRLEWKLAAQRTHTMADEKTFLLPVLIDDTRDAAAKVPAEFKAVQWTRLPGGETPPAFCLRVKKLLGGDPTITDTEQEAVKHPAVPVARPKALRGMRLVLASAAIVVAVLAVTLLKKSPPPTAEKSASPASRAGSYVSRPEVAQLLERVRVTTAKFDDILHTELDMTEDLLRQAAKLDPADPSVWAEWAMVDCRYINHYYDRTPARRDAARRHAAQAAALGPERPDVRLAQADVMASLAKEATKEEATRILLPLLKETPGDGRVPLLLGWEAFDFHRPEASLEWFDRAAREPGYAVAGHFAKARMLIHVKRPSEVGAELDRALAAGNSAEVLLWKAFMLAIWDGDLPAARRALAEVPPQFFVEDMPATTRYYVELLSRNYDQAVAAMRAVSHDYVQSVGLTGPTAYFSGFALARSGKEAAAELEWRSALATVERRLVAEPNDQELMQFKALLLAALGDLEAGRKIYQVVQELYGSQHTQMEELLCLQLLPANEAFDWLARKMAGDDGDFAAQLRLDPFYDRVRADPRFPALLARAEADPRFSPFGKSPPADSASRASDSGAVLSLATDAKSVAVLAFANLSDDKANEYFSDGISEELLNVLAKVPGLKVSARTSAFYFKGKEVPIPEIARQLGVAYVVEGSVRKQGDKVRITAQLIKAADGFHVWSDTFTRDLRDVFAVQDEIAGLVAQNLELKMGLANRSSSLVANSEANERYFEALAAWNERTPSSLAKANDLLLKTLALEPRFARAKALLSQTVTIAADMGMPGMTRQRGLQLADEALALDPLLAQAHAARGGALGVWTGPRRDAAIAELRKSIELDPNYATGHQWLGRELGADGRMAEELASLGRAAELDPLSHRILDNYAQALAWSGDLPQAIVTVDRALQLQPNSVQARLFRAVFFLEEGRPEEALALLADAQVARIFPFIHAQALLALGRRAEATALVSATTDDFQRGLVLCALGSASEGWPLLQPRRSVEREVLLWGATKLLPREDPAFLQALADWGLLEAWQRAEAWRTEHPRRKGQVRI